MSASTSMRRFQAGSQWLRSGLREAMCSELFSDVTLICDDGTLKLHQCVLAASSEFLHELLNGGSQWFEEPATLLLPDFRMNQVSQLFQFLYGCSHDEVIYDLELANLLRIGHWSRPKNLPSPSRLRSQTIKEEPISEPAIVNDEIGDKPVKSAPEVSLSGLPSPYHSSMKSDILREVNGKFECTNCKMIVTKKVLFTNHLCLLSHKKQNPHFEQMDSQPFEMCGGCFQNFNTRNSLLSHLETQCLGNGKENTFFCKRCPLIFYDYDSVCFHTMLHDDKFQCVYCDKNFRSSHLYLRHWTQLHSQVQQVVQRTYNCGFCNEAFESKKKFKQHKAEHTNKRIPFLCTICNKSYKSKSSLHSHIQTHTKKNLQCPVCLKPFKSEKGLKHHLDAHNGKTNYICNDCGKGFVTQQKLVNHRRAKHTHEQPFTCDVCGGRFSRSDKLLTHRRRFHTLERPYKCDECGWQGVDSSALIHHKKKHRKKSLVPQSIPTQDQSVNQVEPVNKINPSSRSDVRRNVSSETTFKTVYLPVIESEEQVPVYLDPSHQQHHTIHFSEHHHDVVGPLVDAISNHVELSENHTSSSAQISATQSVVSAHRFISSSATYHPLHESEGGLLQSIENDQHIQTLR